MKIALLSHEGGGISTVCNGLANSLAMKKIETTVFTTTTSRNTQFEEINEYLKIVHLPLVDLPPRILWFRLLNFTKFRGIFEGYDVIHAVSPEMAFSFNSLRKKQLRSQLVTTFHGSPRAAMKYFIRSPMKYWVPSDFAFHVLELPIHEKTTMSCFTDSHKVAACSFTTLKELRDFESIDISKIRVIYNGIDFNEIPSVDLPVASERDESEYTLIYAGRLFWMKGVQFVLMAYENLRKQFKNLRLRIFGQGPMRNEVERFITSKGLGKDVFFGGLLPHRMLLKEIAKSDIAVFPSLYESQPMFILEAMACKKALVAFDLPYSREMIRNGYSGLLARAYDVKDLSDKIALLLLDRTLRLELGRNAYKYTRENHDWSKQAEKYLNIYSEADAI